MDVCVIGNFAYLADGWDGLYIIDVTDPSNPLEAGIYDTPGSADAVTIKDTLAFVADAWEGLRIINISDPGNPVEIGYLNTDGSAEDVAVSGDYAYVADDYNGLRIILIETPTLPVEAGHFDMPSAIGVALDSSYAYVSGWSDGLRIINILDPFNPFEAGYYNTGGITLAAAVKDNYAYAADGEDGMYVIRNDLITAVKNEGPGPGPYNFELFQNFPNPYNPVTNIRWQIPEGNRTTLKVYDILGREVVTLVDEYSPAGRYETKFSAVHLSSGVYFYQIQSGAFTSVRKMILLK